MPKERNSDRVTRESKLDPALVNIRRLSKSEEMVGKERSAHSKAGGEVGCLRFKK